MAKALGVPSIERAIWRVPVWFTARSLLARMGGGPDIESADNLIEGRLQSLAERGALVMRTSGSIIDRDFKREFHRLPEMDRG